MKKLGILVCLIALLLVLWDGSETIRFASQAITIWFERLLPSLFVSMVLIRVLYKQHVVSRLCPNWLCGLFRVSKEGMALILSSMLLGFPNGSVLIDESYQQGHLSYASAKRLFLICCFPAPGFVILTVGVSIFHQVRIGLFLFVAQLLAGCFLLLITPASNDTILAPSQEVSAPLLQDISISIKESGIALFMMGGYLMLFMSVTGHLFAFFPEQLALLMRILSEFSSGVFLLQNLTLSLNNALLCTCALLGFGGFCVHLQIYSMTHTLRVSYVLFICYRVLQVVCSLLFFSLFYFF